MQVEVVVQAPYTHQISPDDAASQWAQFNVESALAPLIGRRTLDDAGNNLCVSAGQTYVVDINVRCMGDLIVADVDLVDPATHYLVVSQRLCGRLSARQLRDGIAAIIDEMCAGLRKLPAYMIAEESVFAMRVASRGEPHIFS